MTAIVLVADDRSVTPVEQPTVAELYGAYRLRLVRLATLLVDDQDTAEDVVQDVFSRLPHGWQPAETGKALPYLQRAVVNAARSVLRRRRTARLYVVPHEPEGPGPESEAILAEEHREVLAALNALPTRQREVLVLRYWSDLSEAEIAGTLGISRGTVKSTASRAIDALERALGGTV